ncbi:MAG: hypothetical protein J5972_01015 [Eubacterium sp.]|nr:hypothetical protein [Eubacterium sp.]
MNLSKKNTVMDRLMTIVLVAFAVVILVVIGSIAYETKQEQNESEKKNTTTTAAVSEEPAVDEKYITRYSCKISEGVDEESTGSSFYLELYENNGTYKIFLNADSQKSNLNSGTFLRKEGYIELTDKEGEVSKLYEENEYLITDIAIYEGKVPNTKTFNKTYVSEATGENKVEMKFKKNGKFSQQIIRYGASLDGTDTSDEAEGTYKRNGNFIERTKSDGTKMMPLYLYHDQICTSYYKLEKKGMK